MASITPVVDGFVLRKGELHFIALCEHFKYIYINRTRVFRASKAYSRASPSYLDLAYATPSGHRLAALPTNYEQNGKFHHHHTPILAINMNKPVDPNAPPRVALREDRIAGTTNGWRAWAENREIDEWIQSVAGVLEQGWNDQWVPFPFQ